MPRYTAYGTRTVDGNEREFRMPDIEADDANDARATFNNIIDKEDRFEEYNLDRVEEQ